jgi:hypothetical protein
MGGERVPDVLRVGIAIGMGRGREVLAELTLSLGDVDSTAHILRGGGGGCNISRSIRCFIVSHASSSFFKAIPGSVVTNAISFWGTWFKIPTASPI